MGARFSPQFLETLQARSSLVAIVSAVTKLTNKGKEYTGCCPFHAEKSPSFSVSDIKGVYYCFGCGASGNIFDFLKEKQGLPFPEAVAYLASKCGMPLPTVSPEDAETQHHLDQVYAVLARATRFFQDCLQHPTWGCDARAYLENRNVGHAAISHFSLGFAPTSQAFMAWVGTEKIDPALLIQAGLLRKQEGSATLRPWFWQRLIFPIHDGRGRVVAFGGRCLGDEKPKYLNSPETPVFHKKNTLYGLHHLRQDKPQDVLVVEGYMDVVGLWVGGVKGAVAPLGTAFSAEHGTSLWRHTDTPIFCFDGDDAGRMAGQRACHRLLPILTPGKSARIALMPYGQDPDDVMKTAGAEHFRSLITAAVPLHTFIPRIVFANKAPKGLRALSPEAQVALKEELLAIVAEIKEPQIARAYKNSFLDAFYASLRRKEKVVETAHQSVSLQQWRRRSEWILMAALYHHPALIEEAVPFLENYIFLEKSLGKVQQILSESVEEGIVLEKESITPYFIKEGCENFLKQFREEALLSHGAFALPETPLEEARQCWHSLWMNVGGLPQATMDLEAARQVLAHEMTPEAWERVKYLTELTRRMQNEDNFFEETRG